MQRNSCSTISTTSCGRDETRRRDSKPRLDRHSGQSDNTKLSMSMGSKSPSTEVKTSLRNWWLGCRSTSDIIVAFRLHKLISTKIYQYLELSALRQIVDYRCKSNPEKESDSGHILSYYMIIGVKIQMFANEMFENEICKYANDCTVDRTIVGSISRYLFRWNKIKSNHC